MRKKKNKYKLNLESDLASKHIVAEVAITYDIDSDVMSSLVALRNDVENDEFQLRIARQLEHAIRTLITPYRQEMELMEKLAKMGADIGVHDEDCDCAKTS